MPTDLQIAYQEARTSGGGRGHHAALRHVARAIGVDKETVDRVLKRARRTDVLESKRGPRAVAS